MSSLRALATAIICHIFLFNIALSLFSNTLKCASTVNCDIKCTTANSCNGKTLDALNIVSLFIECSSTQACSNFKLLNGPTDTIVINCAAPNACTDAVFQFSNTQTAFVDCLQNGNDEHTTGSCSNAQFYAQNTASISVNCNALDCYNAQFHVNSSSTAQFTMHNSSDHTYTETSIFGSDITNQLDIKCIHSNSCRENTIYCPHKGNCNIECLDEFACALNVYVLDKDESIYLNTTRLGIYDTDFHCLDSGHMSILAYNYDRNEWGCEDYTTQCCPHILIPQVNTQTCEAHNCDIQCSMNSTCLDIIDATEAQSLYIRCAADGCDGKQIECPSNNCTIVCDEVNSCKDLRIISAHASMDRLYISCMDELACDGLSVWPLYLETTVINEVGLWCLSSRSCQNMTFGYDMTIASLDIRCDDYKSCHHMQFLGHSGMSGGYDATVIKGSFNLDCTALNACSYMQLNLISSATNNTINCDNQKGTSWSENGACYKAKFNLYGMSANVADWSLECNTYDCESASFEWSGYSPRNPSNSFTANCFGANSCLKTYFNGGEATHFDLYCRDNRSCHQAMVRGPSYEEAATNIECGIADNVCSSMKIESRWEYTEDYLSLTCPSRTQTLSPCDDIVMVCDANWGTVINHVDIPLQETCYLHYDEDKEAYDGCNTDRNTSQLVYGIEYCCPLQLPATFAPTTTSTTSTTTTATTIATTTSISTSSTEQSILASETEESISASRTEQSISSTSNVPKESRVESTSTNVIVMTDEKASVGKDKKSNRGVIAGVICGSAFGAVLLVVIVWYLCSSQHRKGRSQASELLANQIGAHSDDGTGVTVDVSSAPPYVPPTPQTEMATNE